MRLAIAAMLAVFLGVVTSSVGRAQGNLIPAYPEKQHGPEKEFSRWRPGVQGGLNISDYSSSPSVSNGSRIGFIIGAEVEYRVTPHLFLQPGLRVVQKGFTYNETSGSSVTNFDARIAYLEIPFLVKGKFRSESQVQPYIFAGPNLGFKLGTNVDVINGTGQLETGPALQVLFKTIDFAVDAGFGGEYHFARRMAGFLQFQTSIGLVNVSDLAGTNWKSRNYQFIFGGLFDL